MPSPILPPSTQAGGVVALRQEMAVPAAWPGQYVPNFSDWRAGDIVLVNGTADRISRTIRIAQRSSLSPITRAGQVCTHAAIYIGSGMVVDATKNIGVSDRSVWNYCQSRSIRVRRLSDPSIPAADIAAISVLAQQHIGEPYSVIQAVISKLFPGSVPTRGALYCSTLVGLVVADATGVDLSSDPAHQPLHPGTLAAHPDLEDVMLEWRSL